MTTATVTPEAMTNSAQQSSLVYTGPLDVLDAGYFEQAVEYFKTRKSQDTALVELPFDELIEQKVQQILSEVSEYAAAVAAIAPETEGQVASEQPSRHGQRLRKVGVGIAKCTFALVGITGAFVAGFGGVTAAQTMFERTPTAAEAPAATSVPTTIVTGSTTTEAPTTTTATPEVVAKPFEAPVNSVIGTISIPKLCENIQMWEYDQSETPLVGTTQDRGLANGAVKLDMLVPDAQRADDCASTEHSGYTDRSEWKAVTAISPDNPSGNVNYYRPIIGHENVDGMPATVYPGQIGLSVFYGHRSTYSAPTKDIEILKPNDTAVVKRADGKDFTYRFMERIQVTPDTADNELRDYYNTKVAEAKAAGRSTDISMMVIGGCGDGAGEPGGDATRVFAVFVLG